MTDDHFPLRNKARLPSSRRVSAAEVQYLLGAEEQLLHSISGGMPLGQVLHKICDALNSEMGNMVSIVSLADDDAMALARIIKSAAMFGLHKFCSAAVLGGDDELLGSVEMYCCVPRRPFLSEVCLIERAACLAAVAIQRHNQA